MKKILVISPYFPPDEAVGSKRSLNLARHLGASGWFPVLLTTPHSGRGNDNLYRHLLPEHLIIVEKYSPAARNNKTASEKKSGNIFAKIPVLKKLHEKGHYYTPFDQYMWYIPYAIKSAKLLVEKYRPEIILVNADPWSSLMVAHKLSRWANIPWIADMRDPWSLHAYKMGQRLSVTQSIIRYYESLFMRSASKIILNTENCCQAYRAHYSPDISAAKFTCIRNAFDRDVYSKPRGANSSDKFSLHYFGSFRDYVRPDRLFTTISDFIHLQKLTPVGFELVLYGDLNDENSTLARQLGLLPYITIQPYIKIPDTLRYLQAASLLVLVDGPDRKLQIPAKLYDYLAANRPIWAISDNDELNQIIQETGTGMVSGYHDKEDCLTTLEKLYTLRNSSWEFDHTAISKYSVQNQIQRFCSVFEEVCNA